MLLRFLLGNSFDNCQLLSPPISPKVMMSRLCDSVRVLGVGWFISKLSENYLHLSPNKLNIRMFSL